MGLSLMAGRPPWVALGVAATACVLLAGWTSWRRRRRRRNEHKPPHENSPGKAGGGSSAPPEVEEPLLREVAAVVEGCATTDSEDEVEEVLSRAELARRGRAKLD